MLTPVSFFFNYSVGYILFLFWPVDTVSFIDVISEFKPTFRSWSKSHLVVIHCCVYVDTPDLVMFG